MSQTKQNTNDKCKKEKIAVFGGAFNPPTLGHLSILNALNHFDQVFLVPSFHHAWGKNMAPFELRCKWINAFIKDTQCTNTSLCDEEKIIYKDKAVTTWDLLNHLQSLFPNAELTFVVGPDNLLNFNKFYRAEEIANKWNLFCCPQRLNIRSTFIREALLQGKSIENMTTASLVTSLRLSDFNSN